MQDWNGKYVIIEDVLATGQPETWVVSAVADSLPNAQRVLHVDGEPERRPKTAFRGEEVGKTLILRGTPSGPSPRHATIYRLTSKGGATGEGEPRADPPTSFATKSPKMARWRVWVAAWIRQIATFLGFVAKLPPTRPRAGEPTGPPTDLERFLLDRAGVATTDQEAYGELNVLGLTGSQAMQAGDLQAAERDFTRSLELARRIHHTASIVKACGSLGLVKAKMGRPREALPYLEEAIAVARENGLAVEEGQTLDHLAGAYADLGDKDRALALYEDRLALARRTGDRIGMAYGSANVGVIHFEKQEFREAAERLQEAAGLFEPFGMGPDLARVYAYLGCTYQALGDAQGCIRAYWAHIELCRQMGDPASAAGSLANLSGVLYSLGKREDAIALAEEACDYLGRMWSPQGASLRARLERWKRGEPS